MPEHDDSAEARLIEAAQGAFARKGRNGARTREIAEAAGLAAPTVNYYFRSKGRLYEAAFAEAFGTFVAGLSDALGKAATFKEALRAFIEHFAGFYAERPDAVGLWMQENLAGGEVAVRLIREGDGAFAFSAFTRMYREAEFAGEVRSVDPHHLFISVMGACLMLPIGRPTLRATLPPLAEHPEAFEAGRAEAIFNLVWHGLAKAA